MNDNKQPDIQLTDAPSLKDILKADSVCDLLSKDDIAKVGAEVRARYMADLTSRSSRALEIERASKLVLEYPTKKTYPFNGASNVKYPLITGAMLDFAGRAYGAILPEGDWVKGVVTQQIASQTPQQAPQSDPANPQGQAPAVPPQPPSNPMQAMADQAAGYMSKQLREDMPEWEPETDKLLHMLPLVGDVFRKTFYDELEKRPRSEIVFPEDFIINYYAKDLESSPYTHRFFKYAFEIEEYTRSEHWREITYSQSEEMPEDKRQDGEDDAALKKPVWFGEHYTRLDLDQDGYPEPYIVTFHLETGQVCRIARNFEDEDVEMKKGKVMRIKRDCYFTQYSFVPSPDGSIYSLGFGTLLLPINEAINTLINEIIDAAHLGIAGGGVIAKGAGFKGGSVSFKMNEYKLMDIDPAKLATAIWTKPAPVISPVLFQTLELLIGAAEKITAVKDLLADRATGNTPEAIGMALVESGLAGFKAIYKRIFRSMRKEYALLAKLNARYVPGRTMYQGAGEEQPVEIDPQIFVAPGIAFEPVTGTGSISDTQKATRANFLSKFMQDPMVNPMEVRRRIFTDTGIPNIDSLLQMPAPSGPDPATQIALNSSEATKNNSMAHLARSQTDGFKAQTEHMKATASIKLLAAQAVNQLAQAKKASGEADLSPIETMLSHIETMTDLANDEQSISQAPPGGMAGVAGAPDDAEDTNVPA